MEINKNHKSGFVTLCGRPNTGKSTLINRLVGEKISIVSPRPQTTRTNLRGIVTTDDYQMILIDTPGMHIARTKLGEYMVKMADSALTDVDAIIFMVDAAAGFGPGDHAVLSSLEDCGIPVFVAVNKVDCSHIKSVAEACAKLNDYPFVKQIVPISAKRGDGVEELISYVSEVLPEGPIYYPTDMVTDQPERIIISELIREKALYRLREEIPHGIGIEIISIEKQPNGTTQIFANMLCEKQSHKSIIIGKGGSMLREIGTAARTDIELLLGSRVDLRLWVKVKPDWRNRANILTELGYSDKN